jgi:hypothetical protein
MFVGVFNKCENISIVWDGASDNINYTMLYFFAWCLLSAKERGWPLRTIVLLRHLVGHTHNRLDALFGQLSKTIYGKHARGASRHDILSFTCFKEMCERVFQNTPLLGFTDVPSCWDVDGDTP